LFKKRNPQDRPDWTPGIIVVQQLVPVYGARDWWAEKAMDKDFSIQPIAPVGGARYDLYTVPTGKLLLIAEVHLSTHDFEGLVNLRAYTAEYARYVSMASMKAGSSLAMVFTKPKRVTEGETLEAYTYGYVSGRVSYSVGGWEITLE